MKKFLVGLLLSLTLIGTVFELSIFPGLKKITNQNISKTLNMPMHKTIVQRVYVKDNNFSEPTDDYNLANTNNNERTVVLPVLEIKPENSGQDTLKQYVLTITGPGGKLSGPVLISDDGTVYTTLPILVKEMNWSFTPDGTLFFNQKEENQMLKLDMSQLPTTLVFYRGQTINLAHPVLMLENCVYVPLSDLKKMWLLDFSIDPVTRTLAFK